MNYYEEIKQELINNEVYKKVKDYSKNKSDLSTYYNVGKMLSEDGKHYGEGIIIKYSRKLTKELGRGYSIRNLYNMKLFYDTFEKVQTLSAKLTWSHYQEILPIIEESKRNYYINICIKLNLSVRELRERIKNNEYERLEFVNKENIKLNEEPNKVSDLIKNPIILKSNLDKERISEKVLKELILNNIEEFLEELGNGFSFIKSEYKIKIGDRYNYIDLLLYNIEFNCYIVVELKVTELKKEHIGQIETYMNYIDKHIKKINQDKTIGIIITKKDNKFIMEYCSDNRIFNTIYELIG